MYGIVNTHHEEKKWEVSGKVNIFTIYRLIIHVLDIALEINIFHVINVVIRRNTLETYIESKSVLFARVS